MATLPQLALLFLKIGTFGFGGPFALLAIMEKEVVERHRWLTTDDFTQSVGIGTLTPGPIFFAAAVYVGYRLRGILGAATCGLCAVLPSFLLVVGVSALYIDFQTSPLVTSLVQGLSIAVVGLLVSVVFKMGRATIKAPRGIALAVIAFLALAIFDVDPLVPIVAAGAIGAWFLQPTTSAAAEKE